MVESGFEILNIFGATASARGHLDRCYHFAEFFVISTKKSDNSFI